LLVTCPCFSVALVAICMLWFPYAALKVAVRVARWQRVVPGRDLLGPLLVATTLVWSALFKHNPLPSRRLESYTGRWLHAVFSLAFYFVGVRSPRNLDPTAGAITPPGCGVVHTETVADGVHVLTRCYRDGLGSVNACVVIRHADYLLIYNPIRCSPEVYRKFRDPAAFRVVVVLGNWLHHIGADVAIEAFPREDVTVVGSVCAGRRHEPRLRVEDIRQLGLLGVEAMHLQESMYDEWWLCFKPARLLLGCDAFPHQDECIERLHCGGVVLCFDRHGYALTQDLPMLSLHRAAIVDRQAIAARIRTVLSWDWSTGIGAHPSTKSGDLVARSDIEEYWAWLLDEVNMDEQHSQKIGWRSCARMLCVWRAISKGCAMPLLEPLVP